MWEKIYGDECAGEEKERNEAEVDGQHRIKDDTDDTIDWRQAIPGSLEATGQEY